MPQPEPRPEPRQNRVLPTSQIVAHAGRGLFMGNRGILHDADGLGHARWRHKAWVCCLLRFKGRRRTLMQPGAYTELFFLDEATAFAAGHRPCGECRRADYTAFRDALNWTDTIQGLDRILHAERAIPRRFEQRRHRVRAQDLPDGAMILSDDGTPLLIAGDSARAFRPDGYAIAQHRPTGMVTLLTPPTTCRALQAGYRPRLHPSADS
ncbi:MAG: hypothetical protein OIF47_00950 [Marinibacterium sp.]|nr:hypothetical protein [Marinibacterium sp.]